MRGETVRRQTSDRHCDGERIPYLRQELLCREISRLRFAPLEMIGIGEI